jgi:hypothetical protein
VQSLKNKSHLVLIITISWSEFEAKIMLVINFSTYIFHGRNTLPAETWVQIHFGTIRIDELVAARLVELVVHSLDLARAVGQQPRLDPVAQNVTVNIFTALLEGPRPIELVDDILFIEAVTGRVPYPAVVVPGAFS